MIYLSLIFLFYKGVHGIRASALGFVDVGRTLVETKCESELM